MGFPLSEMRGNETGNRVAQLELLLREAYHRIANSLQLASAVVGREAGVSCDPVAKARLEATRQHIEAIAGVHALLSLGPPTEMVPLDAYLARLVEGLQRSVTNGAGSRIISLRCGSCDVPPEFAVCFGMIVNELVGNACKYAYRQDETGEVRVRFTASGGAFKLEVEDDGPGFDPRKEPDASGFGTPMISAMARRIGAEFRYEDRALGTLAVVHGTARSLMSGREAFSHQAHSVR